MTGFVSCDIEDFGFSGFGFLGVLVSGGLCVVFLAICGF